jgi:hypothetical protein
MDHLERGATLEDVVARELSRRFSASDAALTLDEALACLAHVCWEEAQAPDPYQDEEAARNLIHEALEVAARHHFRFLAARRIFDTFLTMNRPVLPRVKDSLTSRLQRTYWLMANRLRDTTVFDPDRRCRTACERPQDCRSVNDPAQVRCVKSLIFPYDREETVSDAIVTGLTRFRDQHPTELPHIPTKDAVRLDLRRYRDRADERNQQFRQKL